MDSKKRSHNGEEIVVNKFDEESAQDFRDQLLEMSKMDPTRPVVINIDSYGGAADALAKMIEAMDETPNPLITVCHGKAMSCGAILLSHGDLRFCGKHSRVMIHEVSGGAAGDVHDVFADAMEAKRINAYFTGLLAKNCGISGGYEALRKLIKDQDGRDRYMNADQAVKFGIVDAIGTPRIESMFVHNISLVPPKEKKSPTKSKTKKRKTAKKNNKGKTDSN